MPKDDRIAKYLEPPTDLHIVGIEAAIALLGPDNPPSFLITRRELEEVAGVVCRHFGLSHKLVPPEDLPTMSSWVLAAPFVSVISYMPDVNESIGDDEPKIVGFTTAAPAFYCSMFEAAGGVIARPVYAAARPVAAGDVANHA